MDQQTNDLIKNEIENNDVCLFMKGTPDAPQCGFSMATSNILKILEVNHLFQAAGLHCQQVAQATGHRFEEPDVHDGRGQFDMPHPLTANSRMSYFNAAAVANHSLIFHAPVFTTSTFPVLLRTKNPLAKQSVFFRPKGSIINCFWFFYFSP